MYIAYKSNHNEYKLPTQSEHHPVPGPAITSTIWTVGVFIINLVSICLTADSPGIRYAEQQNSLLEDDL